MLLIDPSPPAVAPQLAFVAGLAVHDAAARAAPHLAPSLALKWPNDLLCRQRKLAGILIEGNSDSIAIAIGIGVNCRHHPDAAEFPATDFAADGAAVSSEGLFEFLAAAMQERIRQWSRGAGFAAIRAHWLDRACGVGERLSVRLSSGSVTSGCFEGIDMAGRLLLRREEGTLEAISAGEVFPLTQVA